MFMSGRILDQENKYRVINRWYSWRRSPRKPREWERKAAKDRTPALQHPGAWRRRRARTEVWGDDQRSGDQHGTQGRVGCWGQGVISGVEWHRAVQKDRRWGKPFWSNPRGRRQAAPCWELDQREEKTECPLSQGDRVWREKDGPVIVWDCRALRMLVSQKVKVYREKLHYMEGTAARGRKWWSRKADDHRELEAPPPAEAGTHPLIQEGRRMDRQMSVCLGSPD